MTEYELKQWRNSGGFTVPIPSSSGCHCFSLEIQPDSLVREDVFRQ